MCDIVTHSMTIYDIDTHGVTMCDIVTQGMTICDIVTNGVTICDIVTISASGLQYTCVQHKLLVLISWSHGLTNKFTHYK